MKQNRIGWLFLSPYLIHFAVFLAFPIVFSLVLLFHQWDVVSPLKFVGLQNFTKVFQDKLFFKALFNTFYFLIIHIPLQIIVALLLAVILNRKIKFRGFFRAVYFLPVVVSGVVITMLWKIGRASCRERV